MPLEAKVSTLSNGVRIATIDSNSAVTHIGIFIDSGSRYESHDVTGISHFLEKMAFKSTELRSEFGFFREMSALGSNVTCQASRESVVYSADALRSYVPFVVRALADMLQRSSFSAIDIREAKETYLKELHLIEPKMDSLMPDLLHEAAYGATGLGAPLHASEHTLEHFDSDVLVRWMKEHYTAERIVISAVGYSHAELGDLVTEYFSRLPRNIGQSSEPKARYTGGHVRNNHVRDAPHLINVGIGFETASWHDDDLVPVCVLQMMMGGGGSFSQGGPGKGMYSRIYQNVLNAHGWVEHAQSLLNVYNDTGLFALVGKTHGQHADSLIQVLLEQAHRMAGPVSQEELARSKNALQSSVLLQLESRALQVEDMGRQVMAYGKVIGAEELVKKISAVSEADIQRVAKKMVKTPLTFAAVGETGHLSRYEDVIGYARSFKS
jgi:processing peptidase subunit alpha